MITKMCVNCNKLSSNHEVYDPWGIPKDLSLCCKCYVNKGYFPFDWHPLCMYTYERNIKINARLRHAGIADNI